MHSATKYLNGHSDVVAGALVTARADELWAAARRRCATTPARSSAASRPGCCCAACARSICASRAPPRARSSSPSACAAHPQVAQVLYPGLPGPPRPRDRRAPDAGRLRRHAVDPRHGRRGGGDRDRGAGRALAARDLARRRREPDRAPRLDRGPGHAGAAPTCSASRSASSTPTTCSPTSPRRSTGSTRPRPSPRPPRAPYLLKAQPTPVAATREGTHGDQSELHARGMAASCCRARCWRAWRSPRPTRAACSAWSRRASPRAARSPRPRPRAAANELIRAVVADFETAEGRDAARDGLKTRFAGAKAADVKPKAITALREVRSPPRRQGARGRRGLQGLARRPRPPRRRSLQGGRLPGLRRRPGERRREGDAGGDRAPPLNRTALKPRVSVTRALPSPAGLTRGSRGRFLLRLEEELLALLGRELPRDDAPRVVDQLLCRSGTRARSAPCRPPRRSPPAPRPG